VLSRSRVRAEALAYDPVHHLLEFSTEQGKVQESVGLFVTRQARLSPNREALVDIASGRRLTFADLNRRVNRLASALSQKLKCGDRIAVLLKNQPEYVESYFAIAKSGAVMVPLNWRFVADELAFVISDSGSTALIYGAEFDDTVRKLRKKAQIGTWIRVGEGPDPDAERYEELLECGSEAEPPITAHDDDLLMIVYTSGTTGFPKGAMLSHSNMLWACLTWNSTLDMRPLDRHLLLLPLFHLGGSFPLSAAHHRGQTVVLMKSADPDNILQVIGREKINVGVIVTTILRRMLEALEHHRYNLSPLRWLVVGGEAVPALLVRSAAEMGIEVLQDYGLTEACGIATIISSEDALRKAGSSGKAYVHTDVRIVDESGQDVAPGQLGEILVRARHVMKGYWNRPEATSHSLRSGWLYTGDVATLDEEGYVYIRERKKDMIISGGENIYPTEVEQVLQRHPHIKEVAVIGQPSATWGESPVAVVVRKENASITLEELRSYCRDKLAGYKIPRTVEFVDELPRNPTGKVQKHLLEADRIGGEGRKGLVHVLLQSESFRLGLGANLRQRPVEGLAHVEGFGPQLELARFHL